MSGAERWMRRALGLARHGAGHVSPNPMVGAVLVGPDGDVLGEGWHGEYGGPHAEVWAVIDAEKKHGAEMLREATMFVTLEPCSHHGKTPPCADLIVEKRIPRVIVGMRDPFPKVDGSGIERLRAHGVDVTMGVLEAECKRLNEAFVHHVRTGRPLVTLKIAQTLDGSVATASGDSQWISGEEARRLVHRWRAELDGVLVGSGTARADDPALTVRHAWPGRRSGLEGRQPARVVLDRTGTLPADLQLFIDDHAAKTIAAVGEGATPNYAEAFEQRGGTVLPIPERNGHLDLGALLQQLGVGVGGHRPMQSLLVEAGPGLTTALFRSDLVDRFALFIAPKLVGGRRAVDNLSIARMADARTFETHRWEAVGPDMLFVGYARVV